MSELLDYSGYATRVRGLGPGERVVLWVRGCTIGCPGCMTPDLWAKGVARPIEPLAQELAAHLQSHDGLSISGGEPFQQPLEVANLLDRVRALVGTHVLCYSGFTIKHLRRNVEAAVLLSKIDVLMDGPYLQGKGNSKAWRGSDNQRMHLLTAQAMDATDELAGEKRELQIQSCADGSLRVIGIPRREDWAVFRHLLQQRGFRVEGAD